MIVPHSKPVILGMVLTATLWSSPVGAQSNQSSSSGAAAKSQGHVSAEIVKGKLNPSTSKPGDQVTARVKEDFKSNGQVILKKGSTLTGVVKNVKRIDDKSDARSKSSAHSVIEMEWLGPAEHLNLALESLAYTPPLGAHEDANASNEANPVVQPATTSRSSGNGGGLLGGGGGLVGGVAGGAAATVGVVSNASGQIAAPTVGRAGGIANSPVSTVTATSMQNDFGVSGNNLFLLGHGQVVSGGGTASAIDVYSHMSGDSILASSSKDYEISSGAQMQFQVATGR